MRWGGRSRADGLGQTGAMEYDGNPHRLGWRVAGQPCGWGRGVVRRCEQGVGLSLASWFRYRPPHWANILGQVLKTRANSAFQRRTCLRQQMRQKNSCHTGPWRVSTTRQTFHMRRWRTEHHQRPGQASIDCPRRKTPRGVMGAHPTLRHGTSSGTAYGLTWSPSSDASAGQVVGF